MRIDLAPRPQSIDSGEPPKLEILYYTDPCSSLCWALEPVVKKIKEVYSGQVDIIYRMGGLLESWADSFGHGTTINRPELVALLWSETARKSGMPIDEEIWFHDPPTSTYPGCIAFKAASLQEHGRAERYLRKLREAVLTERLNISKHTVLFDLASESGFEMDKFREDFLTGRAGAAFWEDLEAARGRGIKTFPTLVVCNTDGQESTLIGLRNYKDYEKVINRLTPSPLYRMPLGPLPSFVRKYESVTTPEVSEVYDLSEEEAMTELKNCVANQEIVNIAKAGGDFWQSGPLSL